jgi:chromate transporter
VGGLIAGLLFVLPGAVVIFLLAYIYALFGSVSFIKTLFLGIKAAVLAIVIQALLRVAQRALQGVAHWVIAGIAFLGLFVVNLPYPLIILSAGLYGLLFVKSATKAPSSVATDRISVKKTAVTALLWLTIWLLPIAGVYYFSGVDILANLGVFFSKLAVVTFGGAYAVLAYMSQDVVNAHGWLTAGEMMDGLGLAETTPGPLILVTEFVGFIASHHEGGLPIAIAGTLVTLWATFTPCFLWIFVAAPYVEWISAQPRLNSALSAITAAVVGVIVNLSLWFGLHILFATVNLQSYGMLSVWLPNIETLHWQALLLTIISGLLLLKLRWSIVKVLMAAAILGWFLSLLAR